MWKNTFSDLSGIHILDKVYDQREEEHPLAQIKEECVWSSPNGGVCPCPSCLLCLGSVPGWWNTLLTLFGSKISGRGHFLVSDQKGKPLSVTLWGAQTLIFYSEQVKPSQQFHCTLQKGTWERPHRLLSAEWRQQNMWNKGAGGLWSDQMVNVLWRESLLPAGGSFHSKEAKRHQQGSPFFYK